MLGKDYLVQIHAATLNTHGADEKSTSETL